RTLSHTFRRLLILLFCSMLCAACSNGRGSVSEGAPVGESPPTQEPPTQEPPPQPEPPPPPPDPPPPQPDPEPAPAHMDFAGYWKGTVQEAGGGRARTGVAFVDVSGDMHLMVLRDDEE